MSSEDFSSEVVKWATKTPDVRAIVLAGSRASATRDFDHNSDWDFHLITSQPGRYRTTGWLSELGRPIWCANAAISPRRVLKVSAVFADGEEADFIPLSSFQMKLVYLAMRYPGMRSIFPARLVAGIYETKAFLLGSGYKVIFGGDAWERRLAATSVIWPERYIGSDALHDCSERFWLRAVWLTKRIARGELRSAQHWIHKTSLECVYFVLEEEARLMGKASRPEARKAEMWLAPERLSGTVFSTDIDARSLSIALLSQMQLFEEASKSVADFLDIEPRDYSAVSQWVRRELARWLSEAED